MVASVGAISHFRGPVVLLVLLVAAAAACINLACQLKPALSPAKLAPVAGATALCFALHLCTARWLVRDTTAACLLLGAAGAWAALQWVGCAGRSPYGPTQAPSLFSTWGMHAVVAAGIVAVFASLRLSSVVGGVGAALVFLLHRKLGS